MSRVWGEVYAVMFPETHIDHESGLPLYLQIQEDLMDMINSGALEIGARLPSEPDLSKRYGVSRLTVRQALSDLVANGTLRRQRGVGTFVAQPKMVMSQEVTLSFTQRMQQEGRTCSSHVLSLDIQAAARETAHRLGLDTGAPVICLSRLRLADGRPAMLETAWLSYQHFPDLLGEDFRYRSLYACLAERYAVTIEDVEESLEAVNLGQAEAGLLGVAEGKAALLVTVLALDQEKRPVELSRAYVLGDACRYVFQLRNATSGAKGQ